MSFRVQDNDSLLIRRLKLIYLVPIIVIAYIPLIIYAGITEVGNPFEDVPEAWRRRQG